MPRKTKPKTPTDKNKTNDALVKTITERADDAMTLTTVWEQDNLKWHRMRMRIKKAKNKPFPGCANLRMPTIETKIRKLKAALVNVIFGIRPVVQVIPNPGGNFNSAIKIEKFLDHLIMDIVKLKSKAIIAIDQMLEKGFYLMKPYWKTQITTRIEEFDVGTLPLQEAVWLFDPERKPEELIPIIQKRFDVDMSDMVTKDNQEELTRISEELISGKEKIKAEFKDVICNYPDISLAEPERVYVPGDSGYSPQDCEWLIHEFFLPLETVKANGELKKWNLEDIEDLETALATKDKDIDTLKETREGIEIHDRTGKVKIWECYCWHDINNDGENERCIITIAPDFDIVLRKITLPFYSGKIPLVKMFYELTDDRWFSHRGIPELIEDIVKEIDIQHCQKIDHQTICNSPMFVHRANMVNKNTLQFVFGQSLPVHGMQPLDDIIRPLNRNNPNIEFSYEREQMMLETKVEELIGQVDFTLQSMINKRQPRTLGEVQLQNQNMQQVFSLDADMLRTAFEDLFNWVWELWCQYGDDTYEFAYFGKDGWEPIRLTKEEVQGHYKITVRGNDQNTNPQTRLQKAQAIMAGLQNQLAIQMGVITPMNVANAYKRFYQELDIPNWEELISMPQPPQPPPPGSDIKVMFQELEDGEKAQILKNRGIQPDIQSRSLKSDAMIKEKRQDALSQKVDNLQKVADMVGGQDIGREEGIGG